MSQGKVLHRLVGLEADNLLAFLTLLGLLRALEAADRARPDAARLHARAAWDLTQGPLRPVLHLARPTTQKEVAVAADEGILALVADHHFAGRENLDFTRAQTRDLLARAAAHASLDRRGHVDLLAALMSDGAVKTDKAARTDEAPIDPTPLCLLFGQGHQYFLARLASVPALPAPPARAKGRAAEASSPGACLEQTLFAPWHRQDATFSFRWDPDEDARYALMAGDPTDDTYKFRTQHGANRLAAVGLAALTVVPEIRAGRVRPMVPGGAVDRRGFSFAWPVWREPASLSTVRGLLSHPHLRHPAQLRYLGVEFVFVARRIANGKFMNFARAEILDA